MRILSGYNATREPRQSAFISNKKHIKGKQCLSASKTHHHNFKGAYKTSTDLEYITVYLDNKVFYPKQSRTQNIFAKVFNRLKNTVKT